MGRSMSWLEPRPRGLLTGVLLSVLAGGTSLTLGGIVPEVVEALLSRAWPSLPSVSLGAGAQVTATGPTPAPAVVVERRATPPRVDPLAAPLCPGLTLTIASELEDADASLATLRAADGSSATRGFRGRVGEAQVVYVGTDPLRGKPTAWLLRERSLCRAVLFDSQPAVTGGAGPAPSKAPPSLYRGVERIDDGRYRVERKLLDSLLEHPERLASGVLGGPAAGAFLLRRVKPGSLAEALGLQSLDRIVEVDGTKLSDVEGLMRAAAALPHKRRLSLVLERGGRRFAREYVIE